MNGTPNNKPLTLLQQTYNYWLASTASRNTSQASVSMNVSEAFELIRQAQEYQGTPKLKEHLHVLKFDLVEGNTKWRKTNDQRSASILSMKR